MNNLFRITVTLVLTTALLFACSKENEQAPAAFPDSLVDDEEVVLIGSHSITGRDLRVFTMVYQPTAFDSMYSRFFNLQLLNGYIDRFLLWQAANAQGIEVSDSTTGWFVTEFVASMGGERTFYGFLGRYGITERDVTKTVHRDLVVRSFIEGPLSSAIVVTDEEVRAFYDDNPDRFVAKDSVRARHIILRSSPDDTEEDQKNKRERLEDLQRRVLAGENFAELAQANSEGPSAPRGGDLGYFSRADMVTEFSDVAFALQPGEVSGVVETSFGYHIIKVEDRRSARPVTFEELSPQIHLMLQQQKIGDELTSQMKRNREVAIIEPMFDFGGLTQRESATFTR